MSEHWTMNRIGFVNFWLYDVEEFPFEDGKLLLRGQNGSGKSITTQSFIPFILDGDRTPSRLDPFGSGDRKMEYYFLGEEGKEESTGYLYLEFYKKDTDEYRTIGIGQRARKGKPMDFWGFVILDGRRIGRNVWLYKEVGNSKIPLDKVELKKVLGEETPFTDVPREYKALVNKYLFGFSRAEQYEQFIKLLVKVRAPKLSKEFKPTKVYEILNDSLQTLTDEDLRPMVDAMEKMDSIQENLKQLNRALSDVKIIRNEYMRYNQYMLGKKAASYLSAQNAVSQAQEHVDKQKTDKLLLQEEQSEKTMAQIELSNRSKLIRAELESLLDTELDEIDTKLEKVNSEKEEEQSLERRAKDRIAKSREHIREWDNRLYSLNGEKEYKLSCMEESAEELGNIQEALQWNAHEKAQKCIEERDVEASRDIMMLLQQYQRDLLNGRHKVEMHEHTQRDRDAVYEEKEKIREELEEKKAKERQELKNLEDIREETIAAFFDWHDSNQECRLLPEKLAEVEAILQEYQGTADSAVYHQKLMEAFALCKEELTDILREKQRELQVQKDCLAEWKKEYEQIQFSEELEPERREAVKTSRSMLEAAGIHVLPFYQTVEFAPELSAEEAARLEAQLDACGLLDALVVSDGDFQRIEVEFPTLADCIVRPLKKGNSEFRKLVVNKELDEELQTVVSNILSNIQEKRNLKEAGVCLETTGYFGHGILFGKAEYRKTAEYVGILARLQKKERLLRELALKMNQLEETIASLEVEKEQTEERLVCLQKEYRSAPVTKNLDERIEEVQAIHNSCEQIEQALRRQEKKLEEWEQKLKKSYQEMLAVCKQFPYGRTVAEYQEAVDAVMEYQQFWQSVRDFMTQLVQSEANIQKLQEQIEHEEENVDNEDLNQKKAARRIAELELKMKQYEEYLNQPEIQEKARKRKELKEAQEKTEMELREIEKRLAVIEDNIEGILEHEEPLRTDLIAKIARETKLKKYFEEEMNLNLVFEREARSLEICAKEAVDSMREGDVGRDVGSLTNSLHQVYSSHNSNLVSYGTAMEECFEEAEPGLEALRKRQRIVSVWNGKKLYLEEFFQMLKSAIEETALLIQKKDRELFEDILSRTISQQLTDRIAESRKWVQDMSALMKIDTSMGLYFSLDWRPKTAENDGELDTKELEKILLRDYELLSQDDIEKVAAHFRSRIQAEKQKAEEQGDTINYLDLVRDALDYRKWFEFQMSYYRNNEGKKNLTNSAFNKFSGGEKAMAMYVPLFAAVNAQYKKAEKRDHPRMIALDEAFAGVDDKNISSMFKLVGDMDLDYIMNSQALWGCFETVSALHIAELLRPMNSQVITVIHYTWNGHERILDEQ